MSSSPRVKYQPLVQWTTSDEDEDDYEDNVLYDSRLVKGPMMARKDIFELDLSGLNRSKYSTVQKNKVRIIFKSFFNLLYNFSQENYLNLFTKE